MIVWVIFFLFPKTILASEKDTLKAGEGVPVYSTIVFLNGDSIHAYLEYVDYISDQYGKGETATLNYSYDPRFYYRSQQKIGLDSVAELYLGHTHYLRMFSDGKKGKGALAQILQDGKVKLFRYEVTTTHDAVNTAIWVSTEEAYILMKGKEVYVLVVKEGDEIPARVQSKDFQIIFYKRADLASLCAKVLEVDQLTQDLISSEAKGYKLKDLPQLVKQYNQQNSP